MPGTNGFYPPGWFSGLARAVCLREQISVMFQDIRHTRMLCSERLLKDLYCQQEEIFGLRVLSLTRIEAGQISGRLSHIGVIRAEELLADCPRPQIARLGLRGVTLFRVQARQVVEAARHIGVPWTLDTLP